MSAPAVMLAMQLAAAAPVIGVAAASQDGGICIAMPGPALSAGAALTLVRPDTPQSTFVTTILRGVSACEVLERALVPGPYYVARQPATTPADRAAVWVAFPGSLQTRRHASGVIVTRVSPAFPAVQVRSCTSREGLHLTAWAGAPLVSRRLLHQYYYLGYDVEPSCDERDGAGWAAAICIRA